MKHGVLYYIIADAIADLRAFLWSMYDDERQMIQLIEADARAALRGGKY